MTTLAAYRIIYRMGQWEPPEGWEKVGLLMRAEYHKKIRMVAAEAGVKPWEVLDRLLSPSLRGKKTPKFEELQG